MVSKIPRILRHLVIAASAAGIAFTVAVAIRAQEITDVFPSEEYVARRAALMGTIGDAVAIIQGTTERPGEQHFRQGNQFCYLFGPINQPRIIAVLDGKNKRTTLYLNRDRAERAYGVKSLGPDEASAKQAGVDAIEPRDSFAGAVPRFAADKRTIFTPFRPEVLGEASASDASGQANATKRDPWDGRQSREEAFIAKLKSAAPESTIKDLDPLLDRMRGTKSAREIEVMREATMVAGLGIMEAMRDVRPGMYEYEVQADADFVYKRFGSYGPSFNALIMAGPNTLFSNYHKNTAKIQDGDFVEIDYSPDYKGYSSDITRIFPANGKFTPVQREAYTVYLRIYQALLTSIQVHMAPRDIIKAAVLKMDTILGAYKFTNPNVKTAATTFVERYRNSRANSLGHTVGMEVHDVRNPTETLEPGQIFTIEPQMNVPEEHFGIRLEDILLITESGCENLSAFVPIEIAEVAKLMKDPGLSDAALKRPIKR
jgi:Xaa-Pro aminopeptidase